MGTVMPGSLPQQGAQVVADDRHVRLCVTGLRGVPDVMGGVETHCEELLPRIAKLAPGIEIEVLARKPYVEKDRFRYKDVDVTALYSPKSVRWEAIVSTFLAVIHAYRTRSSLVHFHAIGPSLLAPLARLLGMKVVMTHHGADYNRAKWGFLARQMLRAGEGWGVNAAHRVIAVSPSMADYLRERYPQSREKVRYIPNGAPDLAGEGASQRQCFRSSVCRRAATSSP